MNTSRTAIYRPLPPKPKTVQGAASHAGADSYRGNVRRGRRHTWRRPVRRCGLSALGAGRRRPEPPRRLVPYCGVAARGQGIARACRGVPRDMRKVPAPYGMARGAIHSTTGPADRRPFVVCVPCVAGVRMRRTGLPREGRTGRATGPAAPSRPAWVAAWPYR